MTDQLMLGGFPIEGLSRAENVKIGIGGPPKIGKSSSVGRAYAVTDPQTGIIQFYRVFYLAISDRTGQIPLAFQTLKDGRTIALPNNVLHVAHLNPNFLPPQHKHFLDAFWAIANNLSEWFAGWTPENRWWDAVVIDGLNFLGQAVDQHFEKHGPKGWAKWNKLEEFFLDHLIAWATDLGRARGHGLEIFFLGHTKDPKYHTEGPRAGHLRTRGGMDLPSARLSEQFPGKLDLALRADSIKQPGLSESERVLYSRPDPEWMLGGRFDFLLNTQEKLDLTDILHRLRGYLGRPIPSLSPQPQ